MPEKLSGKRIWKGKKEQSRSDGNFEYDCAPKKCCGRGIGSRVMLC